MSKYQALFGKIEDVLRDDKLDFFHQSKKVGVQLPLCPPPPPPPVLTSLLVTMFKRPSIAQVSRCPMYAAAIG